MRERLSLLSVFWALFTIGVVRAGREGHLKKFGTGPSQPVPEWEGPIDPQTFYRDYLNKRHPLVMRGAARQYPAVSLWDDPFFLKLDISSSVDKIVHVETIKKENRKQTTKDIHFHDFLKQYNDSELYMVQQLPDFLKVFVLLPWPLQCESYNDTIVQVLAWISSGGTSSVVHTDQVDNINCVIRGRKSLVLVDPVRFKDKVPIDVPSGAYSSMDVDSVDFDRYPGMPDVEYYHVNLTQGDCLYIPYLWIHQVRSYDRNIAVNTWFDVNLAQPQGESPNRCKESFDLGWTMEATASIGMEQLEFKLHMQDLIEKQGPFSIESFLNTLVPNDEYSQQYGMGLKMPLYEVFAHLDTNRDAKLDVIDLAQANVESIQRAFDYHTRFDRLLRALFASRDEEGRKDEL